MNLIMHHNFLGVWQSSCYCLAGHAHTHHQPVGKGLAAKLRVEVGSEANAVTMVTQ